VKCFIQLQYMSFGSLGEEDDPAPVLGFRGMAVDNTGELALPAEPVMGQFCDINVYATYEDSVTSIRANVTDTLRDAYGEPLMTCIFLDVAALL